MKNIDELQYVIGFIPENKEVYELALTHPSYNSRANTKHHDYERLEYMGDSVIGFVCADLIFHIHKDMEPGNMTKLRSSCVNTAAEAGYARKINLAEFIRVGNSIDSRQVTNSDKILEDVFEALVGAIYLDKGIDFTYHFLEKFMVEKITNFSEEQLTDYKSKLQEEMQAEHRDVVHYVVSKEIGPSHDKTFEVEVWFNDIKLASGVGKSKKAAEQDAAKKALAKRSKI